MVRGSVARGAGGARREARMGARARGANGAQGEAWVECVARGTRRVWLEAQGAGVRDARRVRCYAREEGRATRGGSIPSGRTDALRHLPHIYIHTLLNIPIFCNGTYNFLHSTKLINNERSIFGGFNCAWLNLKSNKF